MSWIKLFVLSFVVVIAACKSERETSRELSYSAPNPGFSTRYLIEPGSLLSIIDHDSVVIIDMREPAEYRKYHLPGALNIWRSDIENDSLPYQGVLASRSKMESLLGSLGIRNGDYIVIYDDKALCDAARLCWVLDYYGYQNVTLLH